MEFALPVRIRWDVDFRGVAVRAKRIARSIREVGPLSVGLRIDGRKGRAALPALVAEIHKECPAIDVGVRVFPGAAEMLRLGYPARIVWEVTGDGPFSAAVPEGAAAMSFCPDGDSVRFLPQLLDDFASSPVPELHLTNVSAIRSLASRGHVPVPAADEIRRAADATSRLGLSLGVKKLVVHDYFLWRLLRERFPAAAGERMEFSGCQAATALAYVDWEGNVYPCDSLPVRLGNLLDTPFAEIWNSPVRASLAAAIASPPASCESCGDYPGCLAGCRGLAYAVSATLDATDPSCPGPRPPDPS